MKTTAVKKLAALKVELKRNFVWLEEYKCGCSFMAHFKKDLPGYCSKHGDDNKVASLVPVPKDMPIGQRMR